MNFHFIDATHFTATRKHIDAHQIGYLFYMTLSYRFEFSFCEEIHDIFNALCIECQNLQWIVFNNDQLTIS